MKVGLILECGPKGADKQVFEHIIQQFFTDVELGRTITLNDKPNLLAECGAAAAILLEEDHDRVVVIWDLYPAWREDGGKPCRYTDRQSALSSITKATAQTDKVFLVCIEEELEAWLIADGAALSTYLSTESHPVKVADCKKPHFVANPKKRLNRLFDAHRHWEYVDRVHAIKIAQLLDGLKCLRRCPSFKRFEAKITGN